VGRANVNCSVQQRLPFCLNSDTESLNKVSDRRPFVTGFWDEVE